MTTTTDKGLRGLALLDAAIEQIDQHPETWDQKHWRCENGMCVAGWMCELAGGRWLDEPDSAYRNGLVPEPSDDPALVDETRDGRRYVDAIYRAVNLLGCTDIAIFAPSNTLAEIRAMRDQIAAGGLS